MTTPPPGKPVKGSAEDAPPLLGSWRNVYLFVVLTLVVAIAILAIFATVNG